MTPEKAHKDVLDMIERNLSQLLDRPADPEKLLALEIKAIVDRVRFGEYKSAKFLMVDGELKVEIPFRCEPPLDRINLRLAIDYDGLLSLKLDDEAPRNDDFEIEGEKS